MKLRRNKSEERRELQYVFEAFVIEELHRLRPVKGLPREEFIELVNVARGRVHEHDLAVGSSRRF